MSIAGIRSNRGDNYQILVALDWALIVLSDPEFQWLEIDSKTYQVDDVIVGKSDGSLICCQCKKNPTIDVHFLWIQTIFLGLIFLRISGNAGQVFKS